MTAMIEQTTAIKTVFEPEGAVSVLKTTTVLFITRGDSVAPCCCTTCYA